VESTHIDEIVAAIRDARENLKGAINQPVSPEAISKITEKVKELEMPEARVIGPEHKESLAAAEQALASAAEEAARNEKKALKEASSRISDVRQEIEKAGEAAQEAKKAVADVAQQAGSAVITDRKKLEDFVARLPAGKPVMLSAMASGLGMNPELVERTLIEMQKADPQHIVLQDTGYAARLLGKQATLTKK
jgi:DNA repair exonuclease SbcCD ATPase subunit